MSVQNTYLTDEELNQLIADVEANEMVSAPPDMLEGILIRLYRQDGSGEENLSELKNAKDKSAREKEFRLYCFRVITSVAAAIMLLFVMPKAGEMNLKISEVKENMVDGKAQMTPRYATKEDALNDRSLWMETFGDNKLFGGEYRFGIFQD